MDLVLFATAWGPKFGGINAFNEDLAAALATELAGNGNVYCVVPNAPPTDVVAAQSRGVELVSLGKLNGPFERLDEDWVRTLGRWFRAHQKSVPNAWWIGHDVASGDIALTAADEFGGSAALIHHMSYSAYQVVKSLSSLDADRKTRRQEALFKSHGVRLFAIGPLLQQSCKVLSGSSDVVSLVPGFPIFPARAVSQNATVSAITFGRLDRLDDRIKQGRLAAAAFGRAVRLTYENGEPASLTSPEMNFVGLQTAEDEDAIRAVVNEEADAAVNIKILPYDTDRASLLSRLQRANIALTLSWHEGFGLTGWEAIAAEVPLIVGKNSGLYQLINQTLGPEGDRYLVALQVRGPKKADLDFHPDDVGLVANHLLAFGRNLADRRLLAARLKSQLEMALGCTWQDTARAFLEGLGRRGGGIGSPTREPTRAPPSLESQPEPAAVDTPLIVAFDVAKNGTLVVRKNEELRTRRTTKRDREVRASLVSLAENLRTALDRGNKPHVHLLRAVERYLAAALALPNETSDIRLYIEGENVAETLRATELAGGTGDTPELDEDAAAIAMRLVISQQAYAMSTEIGRQAAADRTSFQVEALDAKSVRDAAHAIVLALRNAPDIVDPTVTATLEELSIHLDEDAGRRVLATNTMGNLIATMLRVLVYSWPMAGFDGQFNHPAIAERSKTARVGVRNAGDNVESGLSNKILAFLKANKKAIDFVGRATGQAWIRILTDLL